MNADGGAGRGRRRGNGMNTGGRADGMAGGKRKEVFFLHMFFRGMCRKGLCFCT